MIFSGAAVASTTFSDDPRRSALVPINPKLLERSVGGSHGELWPELIEDAHAHAAAGSAPATIEFGALQVLLNKLAMAEDAIHCHRDLVWFKRKERPKRVPRSARLSKETAQALKGICEEASALGADATLQRISSELVPMFASRLGERAALQAAIQRLKDSSLLIAMTKAFRSAEFTEIAAAAYRRAIQLSGAPDLGNVRYYRSIRAPIKDIQRTVTEVKKARAQVTRRRKVPRTLYVLYRSVPYDTNGYAMRSHYLLRALCSAGQDVIGLTRMGYPWDAEAGKAAAAYREEVDGVTYLHLGGPETLRKFMGMEDYIRESSRRIAHVAAACGADVIHSASNWVAGAPALRAARMVGARFCYEVRGLWEVTRASNVPGYERTEQYALFESMEGLVARGADHVFAITRQVADEMVRRGVSRKKISLAPNGVEIERFGPIEKNRDLCRSLGIGSEIVFGYVGTFAKYEGILDLCAAGVALRRAGHKFKILLVGDGPDLGAAKEMASRDGCSDSFIFTERIPFTEVAGYYSLIDVAVFPRIPTVITEMVAPLKPFEAMAMGLPVIASSVGPLADVIKHGRTGWIFEKGNRQALTDSLAHAIARRSELGRMGREARKDAVACYDWNAVARSISETWAHLCSGGRASGQKKRKAGAR